MNETTYQGNNFWYGWGYATPDKNVVVKFKVTTAPDAESDLVVRTTPLASETVIEYQ